MERCFYPHSFYTLEAADEAKQKQATSTSSSSYLKRRKQRRPQQDEKPAFIKSMAHLKEQFIHPTSGYFCYETLLKEDIQTRFDWRQVPFACTAQGGRLPQERVQRKTTQIENILELCIIFLSHLTAVNTTVNDSVKVVEFCAGSGFVLLPLAAKFPKVSFILLDRKEKSVQIGRERIREANLKNVTIFTGDVRSYKEDFHLGIALHACGIASDLSLQSCIASRAAFVCAPCCIGKILLDRHEALSTAFRKTIDKDDFKYLVKAGDFGHSLEEITQHGEHICSFRRMAKSYIEEDRRLYAVENKYSSYITTMFPPGSTPKDDILIGWPNRDASCFECNYGGINSKNTTNYNDNGTTSKSKKMSYNSKLYDEFDGKIFENHLMGGESLFE